MCSISVSGRRTSEEMRDRLGIKDNSVVTQRAQLR